jgi:hypothetical protein
MSFIDNDEIGRPFHASEAAGQCLDRRDLNRLRGARETGGNHPMRYPELAQLAAGLPDQFTTMDQDQDVVAAG